MKILKNKKDKKFRELCKEGECKVGEVLRIEQFEVTGESLEFVTKSIFDKKENTAILIVGNIYFFKEDVPKPHYFWQGKIILKRINNESFVISSGHGAVSEEFLPEKTRFTQDEDSGPIYICFERFKKQIKYEMLEVEAYEIVLDK